MDTVKTLVFPMIIIWFLKLQSFPYLVYGRLIWQPNELRRVVVHVVYCDDNRVKLLKRTNTNIIMTKEYLSRPRFSRLFIFTIYNINDESLSWLSTLYI